MSAFKMAGLVTVFSAVLYGGFSVGIAAKSLCGRLEGFCRLINFIRSRIECYNQPLHEIYADFEDDALISCGFIDVLRSEGFESALDKSSSLGLDEDAERYIREFAGQLGKSLSAEQIRNCDITLEYLESCLRKEQDKLPQKLRLIRTVSLTAAVMFVIILI